MKFRLRHPKRVWTCDYKGQVIRATFSHNLSRNIVALQVEKGCCTYYHRCSQLVTQQISMLQVAALKKIGQQCVFVSANKMACWPSVISFFTSLVNTVLRLCSCFLRQFGEMLNFWHNSSRALDLRGLFLYSGPQVSHRHGCFSSSLHKSFLWASDIFLLINSQSWVSAFSTSTTSAMFTLPKSDMPEVKRALTHHLSRVFGAGKLTNHKCCEV